MKIQTFIFNWPGKKQHAAKLEAMFRPFCETIVINSDDALRAWHPHWQHIGNEAYFTEQWNAALDRFSGDVFVHIQADIWPVKVGKVLSNAANYISHHGVGVYAPNVDFNAHYYRKDALRKLEEGVFEVPATDCCFWAIKGEILRHAPRVDSRVNKLGWGIEYMVGAVARSKDLKLVRDYRFTAGHEKGSGYDLTQAAAEWVSLRNSLSAQLRKRMETVEAERENLLVSRKSRNLFERYVNAIGDRVRRGAIIMQSRAVAPR
jgi:hypothetical protein